MTRHPIHKLAVYLLDGEDLPRPTTRREVSSLDQAKHAAREWYVQGTAVLLKETWAKHEQTWERTDSQELARWTCGQPRRITLAFDKLRDFGPIPVILGSAEGESPAARTLALHEATSNLANMTGVTFPVAKDYAASLTVVTMEWSAVRLPVGDDPEALRRADRVLDPRAVTHDF